MNFRGFKIEVPNERDIPKGEWKERIESLVHEADVLIPEKGTGLLRYHESGYLEGFAALQTDKGIEVFEFESMQLPKQVAKSFDRAVKTAYFIDLHKKSPQEHIKVYTGDDAITRLQEVRTERRI
ncbi:hypothetical protein HYV80_05550 [Candidatus Woesearchaeota archaeon]|nr:hypothetical protein [Candidatus Woesearchaeota archaeon]